MRPRSPRILPSLAALAAAVGALLAGGCDGGDNPATSDHVITCLGPTPVPWAGDTAASTVTGIVARSGGVVSGAPLTFAADLGQVTAQVTTDANGYAEADYFPPFAPGPEIVTVELRDGGELLGDATCSFTIAPSLVVTASQAPGLPAAIFADPDCDVPLLLDVAVSVDPVGGIPATVALGVKVTGYRASWRRPDGTGQPGVDVPRDVTGVLAVGPASAPVDFAVPDLELILPADVPLLACGEEVTLRVTVELDVDPAAGGDGLATSFSLPVTFRRSCVPCP